MVNHLDYNKKNNNVENLEIISQKENVLYSISSMKKPRKHFKKSATGEKYIHFKSGKYVLCIRQFRFEKYFNTLEEAVAERNEFISDKEYFTK